MCFDGGKLRARVFKRILKNVPIRGLKAGTVFDLLADSGNYASQLKRATNDKCTKAHLKNDAWQELNLKSETVGRTKSRPGYLVFVGFQVNIDKFALVWAVRIYHQMQYGGTQEFWRCDGGLEGF